MFTYATPFVAMPESLRKQWLAWANSHDWGGPSAHYVGDKLVTYGQAHNGVSWFTERMEHATPRDLRDWAGY